MKTIKLYSLIFLGSFLLFFAVVGNFTIIKEEDNNKARSFEDFNLNLVKKTKSMDDLINIIKKETSNFNTLSDKKKMFLLYSIVIERNVHGLAEHTIFSNWLLYFAGNIIHPLKVIFNPEKLVSEGYSLICSQSSYLLMSLALKEDIRVRQVGLYGHVVMEAWYENDWHMYDPDEEVIPLINDKILSVDELSKNISFLEKFYIGEKKSAISTFISRENNTFATNPIGVYFEWKTQVLFYIEKLAEILKYLIPIFLIGIGFYYFRKEKINP